MASRQELVDFLADQGVTLPRSATPQELAAELERDFSVDADGFARALAESRYATAGRVAVGRAAGCAPSSERSGRRSGAASACRARLRGAVSLRSLTA